MIKLSIKKTIWRQINFRSVETMLGAEFLHDLYNRYWPPINSIRFRNTILLVDKSTVTSYAPLEEWDFLSEWFGERFLRGDEEVYKEVNKLINYKKPRLRKLLSKLKSTNFEKIDNIGFGLLLIDLQYTTLAEIYKVNLVQIEYALNYAIDKQLAKYYPNEIKRKEVIANITISSEPTIAMQEEQDFINLVYRGLKKGVDRIYLSKVNSIDLKMKEVFRRLKDHYHKYSFVHSAYGTSPYSLEYYIDRYNNEAKQNVNDIVSKLKMIKESIRLNKKVKLDYLNKFKGDKILLKNINFISKIGALRDRNKALLGTTIFWREVILNQVAKRKKIKREKLNLYFLAEICDLLKYNQRLKISELSRRQKGFILARKECLDFDLKGVEKEILDTLSTNKILKGICASPGTYTGIVKIIRSSKDIRKMRSGDIMVSPGTDFDLINAMQKAGAVITEEGGILSHASVICREMKKPCCISVIGATKKIQDNFMIKLDATNGKVIILDNLNTPKKIKKLTKEEILLVVRKEIKLPSLEEIEWGNLDFFSEGYILPGI